MIWGVLAVAVCLFAQVLCGPVNHLDVFIARKEIKRFFYEFDIGDFYIIRKGVVDNFVKNQVTGYLPAIVTSTQTLELHLKSKYKLYYRLYLSSSDRSIMKTPTANVRLSGQVPRKARSFKVRFPCNRRKSGEAMLIVKMDFAVPSRKKTILTQFVLNLRRKCEARKDVAVKPSTKAKGNVICEKKCNRERVMKRFCISDFAIRARVEKRFVDHGVLKYRVRVTKFYKTARVAIAKRSNIEILGSGVTCKCSNLQLRKTYLILGKENVRRKTLFLDDYTIAIDWSDGGKKLAKLHKKKHVCPKSIFRHWHI